MAVLLAVTILWRLVSKLLAETRAQNQELMAAQLGSISKLSVGSGLHVPPCAAGAAERRGRSGMADHRAGLLVAAKRDRFARDLIIAAQLRRSWSIVSVRMDETPHHRLVELLVELFNAEEFRRHLASIPGVEEVLAELPPPGGSVLALADTAVLALRRRELLDRDWFDRLARVRPRSIEKIDGMRALYVPDGARVVRGEDAGPWRTLVSPPSFLQPTKRRSSGGLALVDIHGPQVNSAARLPDLRFTLENRTAEWLTLTRLTLAATCHQTLAVFTLARPIEPVAHWELAVPEFGGSCTFQADPPFALPPAQATMIAVRLHVLRGGRDRVAPGMCGRYSLEFEFHAGEGVSACSEPIPC